MWIRKWLIAWAALFGLTACAGMESRTATLYELDGQEWLIVSGSRFVGGEGLFRTVESLDIAVRQPDGTYKIVATRRSDADQGQRAIMDDDIQEIYVGDSSTPTLDLRDELVQQGNLTSTADVRQISALSANSLSVPDSAVRPFVAQEDDDMY